MGFNSGFKGLMLSCVEPNVIAVFKVYSLSVILWRIIYIIFSSCKEWDTEHELCIKMRSALHVEEDVLFNGYLRLFYNGRPETLETKVLKLGKARRHLNCGKYYSHVHIKSFRSLKKSYLFSGCTAIARLRSGSPNILWQRATTVIVGWFRRRTWKIITRRVPSRSHYCVVFTVYTQFTNLAASCITQSGGPGVGDHFKSRIKSHLLFAGIIRSSPFSPL